MFTGIVQCVGTVVSTGNARLEVDAPSLPYWPPDGGSIAIDGCCLTHTGGAPLTFDLSDETLSRTTLGLLREGSQVNVEAALRAGEPIGGHFVTGHVDGMGAFLGSSGEEFRFSAPTGGERYLADKGAITIAGVSLTVVRPAGLEFSVALIPHTLQATTLGSLSSGDPVNIEFDVLARYVLGRGEL